jgi:hypothetical protein
MINLANIKRFLTRQAPQEVAHTPLIEKELDDGWIELGTEPTEADFIIISEGAFKKERSVEKMATDVELIAKSEVYKLAIPVKENSDKALASEARLKQQGYTVHPLASDAARSKGIFLYALVNEQNPDAPITVVCRGTQLDASVIADLDPCGPGSVVMAEERAIILGQLNELCKNHPHRKIRVTGHSLGGSLSQILTTELLIEKDNALRDSSLYPELASISGIDTVVFQSAGVSQELAQRGKQCAESIKSLDANFDMSFVAHVKKGDFVSRTGTYIFSDIDSSVVDVSLILRNLDKPCMTLGNYLDVGITGATGGPVGMVASLVKNLTKNYVLNRLQAHSDLFHHNPDGSLALGGTGIYNNVNPEDVATITKVFERDLTAKIPYSKAIKGLLHRRLQHLSSDELSGLSVCAGATLNLVDAAAALAVTGNPVEAGAVLANKFATINTSINAINGQHEQARRGLSNLFGFWPCVREANKESQPVSSPQLVS